MPKGCRVGFVSITSEQRVQLTSWSRRSKTALAMRSRIVLLAAAGQSNTAIAQRLATRPHTMGKYLTNIIEQDHCGIKSRTRPMLGFKNFDCAAITIAGMELLLHIHKTQFPLGRLRLKDQATPALWKTVLAAQ